MVTGIDTVPREVIFMADDVGIVVMVEEGKREHLDQVAKVLEEKGMRVETKLHRFRTIVGSGDSELLEKLKSTDGVEIRSARAEVSAASDERENPAVAWDQLVRNWTAHECADSGDHDDSLCSTGPPAIGARGRRRRNEFRARSRCWLQPIYFRTPDQVANRGVETAAWWELKDARGNCCSRHHGNRAFLTGFC